MASGSFAAPDHDYPSYLELVLTATDSNGVSASVTRRIDPKTVTLAFQTVPTGLSLTVNGTASTAPFSRTVIQGSGNSLTATTPQTVGGAFHAFQSWSDGGSATHTLTPTGSGTYTATYSTAPFTALTLSTVTNDGVAAGESATLIASLDPGTNLSGGTLRIRDVTTDAILATTTTTGSNPTLSHAVSRPSGSHPFRAEFIPASSDVQPAAASYDLVVVDGPRPETVMSSTTIFTSVPSAQSSFSSPVGGVTFECRLDAAAWVACTSPASFSAIGDGTRTIAVRARRADGLVDRTPAVRQWVVDSHAPTGDVLIANGAAFSRSTLVEVQAPGTDLVPGTTQPTPPATLWTRIDGSSWTSRPYVAGLTLTLPATDGPHTVFAMWKDAAGNASSVHSDTIVLDRSRPTVTQPRRGFVPGTAVTSGLVALRVPWSGSDATSGIARYELARSTDGGAWTTISTTLTSPTTELRLATLHSYAFRVRAIDKAGNTGAWVASASFRVGRFSEFNPTIRYSGSWTTVTSFVYWGGGAKKTTRAGAQASITFAGRSVAWVARKGPDRGIARLYVNGTPVATVDLYSPTYQGQRVVWVHSWTTSASRTIAVRALGTAGRPRIDLDALIIAE